MLQHTNKLFLIAEGLPGMGKSTLCKNFKQAIEQHNKLVALSQQPSSPLAQASLATGQQAATACPASHQLMASLGPTPSLQKRIRLEKVSYDKLLGHKIDDFSKTNPDMAFHEILDIIRPKADRQYLEDIAAYVYDSNHTRANVSKEN